MKKNPANYDPRLRFVASYFHNLPRVVCEIFRYSAEVIRGVEQLTLDLDQSLHIFLQDLNQERIQEAPLGGGRISKKCV